MASIELYSEIQPQVLHYTVHATPGSFEAGDLVTVDATGGVKIASTNVVFLGIARTDTSGEGGSGKIPVELIDPNAIYVVRLSSAGTDTTTGATDTIIGDAVGFSAFTAGAQVVTDTATASAYVVGRDQRDASGTVGGRILIRFYGTALTAQY